MAKYLHRLGAWAFAHRRKVLLGWALVLAVVVVCAALFSGRTSDKFEVPGTESQQAQDLLHERFPGAGGAQARVVYYAPAGEKLTDSENKAAVMASVDQLKKADDVETVIDPYQAHALTKDQRLAYADVIYPVPSDQIDSKARDELAAAAEPARDAGLQVEFNGGLVDDSSTTHSEGISLMIGYVVLAITLASLLAAGLPLMNAILGVAIGVTGITALSGIVDTSETAPILATMLGLAVGIDYALFILSRHRQNLADGMTPHDSAANATATAGSAVVFAGTTVVIALVGLTVVNIPFLTVMGLAAAGTVMLAVMIALTLLPAMMGFAGARLGRSNRALEWRPSWLRRKPRTSRKLTTRWASFVTRRPVPVLVTGLLVLSVIAMSAMHMKLGLPDGGSKSTSTTERRAYDLLTKGFGPGFNGQLTAVVDAKNVSEDKQKQVATKLVDGLQDFPGVAAVSQPAQNKAGDLTIVQVTPTSSPASDQTKDLVNAMRDKADQVQADTGIKAYVTGTTALNIDTADRLNAALPKYAAVVVGLALILLMIVFRSLLVPLKAAAGFLMSIAASLGIVVWVFQDGHFASALGIDNPSPIVSFLPILLIGILFGLAMDYEVFLVSRMREAFVHSKKARESVVTGYSQSGRVVVAAAVIMTGVFASFVLDPDPVTKSIGFALAFGVIVDAFVVRLTLVPAAMALLGRSAWSLPHWLDRLLPNVDIEGSSLEKEAEGRGHYKPTPRALPQTQT